MCEFYQISGIMILYFHPTGYRSIYPWDVQWILSIRFIKITQRYILVFFSDNSRHIHSYAVVTVQDIIYVSGGYKKGSIHRKYLKR